MIYDYEVKLAEFLPAIERGRKHKGNYLFITPAGGSLHFGVSDGRFLIMGDIGDFPDKSTWESGIKLTNLWDETKYTKSDVVNIEYDDDSKTITVDISGETMLDNETFVDGSIHKNKELGVYKVFPAMLDVKYFKPNNFKCAILDESSGRVAEYDAYFDVVPGAFDFQSVNAMSRCDSILGIMETSGGGVGFRGSNLFGVVMNIRNPKTTFDVAVSSPKNILSGSPEIKKVPAVQKDLKKHLVYDKLDNPSIFDVLKIGNAHSNVKIKPINGDNLDESFQYNPDLTRILELLFDAIGKNNYRDEVYLLVDFGDIYGGNLHVQITVAMELELSANKSTRTSSLREFYDDLLGLNLDRIFEDYQVKSYNNNWVGDYFIKVLDSKILEIVPSLDYGKMIRFIIPGV